MTYSDIIRNNCEHHSAVNWWPRFAYHMTDVSNATSILSSGFLYSRIQAKYMGIMQNDNASRQVIDITDRSTIAYVRFYFRPLTPTQYYNEGFKHKEIRYHGDDYANMPVPIFLLFDLETILNMKDTRFSELSQAGSGCPLRQGMGDFSNLPFDKIYSNGAANRDIIQYRQAEILYPLFFEIDASLKFILCRNEVDKQTLLNLLKQEDKSAYEKYKERIKIPPHGTFYRNGLFIDNVIYHDNLLSFVFSDTPEKAYYVNKNAKGKEISEVEAMFQFEWINARRTLLSAVSKVEISYLNTKPVVFKLPEVEHAKTLRVRLSIDDKCICVFEQSLSPYDLI